MLRSSQAKVVPTKCKVQTLEPIWTYPDPDRRGCIPMMYEILKNPMIFVKLWEILNYKIC